MKIHVHMYLGHGYLEAFAPEEGNKYLLRLPLNQWTDDATGDIARALARESGMTGKLDTYLKSSGPGRYIYEVVSAESDWDDVREPEPEWRSPRDEHPAQNEFDRSQHVDEL